MKSDLRRPPSLRISPPLHCLGEVARPLPAPVKASPSQVKSGPCHPQTALGLPHVSLTSCPSQSRRFLQRTPVHRPQQSGKAFDSTGLGYASVVLESSDGQSNGACSTMQYGYGCGWKPRSSLVLKVLRRVRVRKSGTPFTKSRAEPGEVGLCDLIATTSHEGAVHGES